MRELVERCSGLPLALGIAGARAASLPSAAALADYVAELRETVTRLDALDAGELTVSLRAVLACSVRALSATPPGSSASWVGLRGRTSA